MFTKIIRYLKESKAEVKKVSWPTKKTVERFTLLVILISIATAIFLGALDASFSWILKTFII
ncbi:MAG: preprotein translocase subunit SecE [Candidatus Moranbacteria bacterium]|jgi:preprotein translocase subunit SecE|nr:preprotein translocase subunit SecE [Candidatus Moranbacteria bacterium]